MGLTHLKCRICLAWLCSEGDGHLRAPAAFFVFAVVIYSVCAIKLLSTAREVFEFASFLSLSSLTFHELASNESPLS